MAAAANQTRFHESTIPWKKRINLASLLGVSVPHFCRVLRGDGWADQPDCKPWRDKLSGPDLRALQREGRPRRRSLSFILIFRTTSSGCRWPRTG